MKWDDLKFFLAVCRAGSIRGAAKVLQVNHATVSRRISAFEEALGERLFERNTKGYLLSKTGEEIFKEASHLEERLNAVERKVAGKDKTLSGEIRVTMPETLGEKLFMEDFADFANLYPKIEFEILESGRNFNLANREADVAFRVCQSPPEHLIGRKLATIHRACYIAKSLLPLAEDPNWLAQQNWIGWTEKQRRPIGKLAREHRTFSSKHKLLSAGLQISACKNGMGVALLPCFIADEDPELARVPPFETEPKWDFWLLYHPDLRHNSKIQTFVRFCIERMEPKRPLIEGDIFEKDQF